MSPQGRRFDQAIARELSGLPGLILVCGRYEGVDDRLIGGLIDEELSIGDYVLTGGEPAAWVVMDAVSRFIPGVVGKGESVRRDSFFDGLLDFPHYTRPRVFRGMRVPQVLFSGNHAKISDWRRREALKRTRELRPDLLAVKKLPPVRRKRPESAPKKGKDNEPR